MKTRKGGVVTSKSGVTVTFEDVGVASSGVYILYSTGSGSASAYVNATGVQGLVYSSGAGLVKKELYLHKLTLAVGQSVSVLAEIINDSYEPFDLTSLHMHLRSNGNVPANGYFLPSSSGALGGVALYLEYGGTAGSVNLNYLATDMTYKLQSVGRVYNDQRIKLL